MRLKSGVADCYSSSERAGMERTQAWRSAALAPLLGRLTAWSVTADGITVASLAAGLLFVPLFPITPLVALGALLLHVILDGVDGPLARYQNRASRKGSFTDTLADQCVLAGVVLTLMSQGFLSPWAGGAMLFTYTLVIAFAMVRNALEIPYRWLIRPRFLLYAAIPLAVWGQFAVLEPLAWVLTAFLTLKVATGFFALRRALD